jgi:HAD superfamily hydrolase (TIGR01450 family)
MKVVILAAGIGSRLRPLTDKKPKGMVKVNGTPIIEHQIKGYLHAGIKEKDIFIVVGYKPEFITDYLQKNYPEINVINNDVYDKTNNMYSLNMALVNINTDIVISNGDCVYDYDIMKDFINFNAPNCIASERDGYTEENMKIIVEEGKIIKIAKTVSEKDAYGNSIDLYKISADDLPVLKEIISSMIEEDENLWSELALDRSFSQLKFTPFDINKRRWMEIDNYEDLHIAEQKFSDFDINSKKCLIVDGDGTVYVGKKPVPGTIKFLQEKMDEFDCYFMTNNTSRDLKGYIKKLNGLGIEIAEDKILSPLLPLTDYLREEEIKNVYIVGNSVFHDYLHEAIPNLSITTDPQKCEAVILGYDTELTYEKLKNATLLLHNKDIKYLATHTDIVCPTEDGYIPDIGSMIALLEKASNRTPDIIFGKPNTILLKSIEAKYDKNEILILGDRLYTDKLFADSANIDFALVLSGESNREDIEEESKFPRVILKDMGELL